MRTLLLIVMFLSSLIAAWRLVRGWRSPVDPLIVAMSFALFGAAGALIDDNWIQALGQGSSLGLAGTSALWAGKPRDPQIQRFAVVTSMQRRLLWSGLILRIAAVFAGLIAFVLWVFEVGNVLERTLATGLVAVMVAASAVLEHRGRPRAFLS
jgi:hypothetical protein